MSESLASLEPCPGLLGPGGIDDLLTRFRAYLAARGYRPRTLSQYIAAATHFLSWLPSEPAGRHRIDTQTVRAFLEDHLPACRCAGSGSRDLKSVRASMNQLLGMQGLARLGSRNTAVSPEIEQWVSRFDTYLERTCGLAETTRRSRCRRVRASLAALFGKGPVDPGDITSEKLIEFVSEQARSYRPASVGALASSLRSFVRWLSLTGASSVSLTSALHKPAGWSLAALPPSLSEADMARFWKVFDRDNPVGRRDYAMARCLADLGLRCQEVAALRLEDIDWRSAVLCLTATKGRRAARIPLPRSTGTALVDYLLHGRPSTSSRAVFVLHRAPLGQAALATTVRGAIRRAFARAALPPSGPHILRHTAATRMIQGGVSLKEIADVLRHRSIDTTRIYTKVDLPQLQRVALPWPGRSS